jgi:hypothetical protein
MLTWMAPAVATTVILGAGAALADPPAPVIVTGDNQGGSVTTDVTAPGASGTAGAPVGDTSPANARSAITCTWTQLSDFAEGLFFALGSGAAGGHYYDVRCSDGSLSLAVYVPPSAPNVPPEVVVAGTLAQQATNRLPLPAPGAQHNPSSDALVGLATWWWVDPLQWRPLQQRTQAGPVWAQVTARPVRSVWDAGDGSDPVVCAGPGQPYDRQRPAREQSSDCTYTYLRSSASQPQRGPDPNDRFFTVTVTVYWQVSWVGSGGTGGALPEIARSSSFPLRVVERQTVVTDGSG